MEMNKPTLLYQSPEGATIHRYQLTGGQQFFDRCLVSYLGNAKFCSDIDEAKKVLNGWIQ